MSKSYSRQYLVVTQLVKLYSYIKRISRKRINPYRSYSINGIDVEVVSTEKDWGSGYRK